MNGTWIYIKTSLKHLANNNTMKALVNAQKIKKKYEYVIFPINHGEKFVSLEPKDVSKETYSSVSNLDWTLYTLL